MAKSHYIVYLDNLRIVGALAVVLLHMSGVCLDRFYNPDTTMQNVLLVLVNTITRFAVPVFVMITGTLLLHPRRIITYDNVFGKYVWRMLLILLTIGSAYALLEIAYIHRAISPALVAEAFANVLSGNLWDHMWYVYMLTGLYLVLPMLKGFVNVSDTGDLVKLVLVMALFLLIMPQVGSVFGLKVGITFPVSSVYVLYLFLGYLIDKTVMEMCGMTKMIGCICLSMSLCFIAVGIHMMNPTPETAAFLSLNPIITFFLANGIFLLFKGSKALNNGPIFGRKAGLMVSDCSFGIYLFHPLFINLATKFFHIDLLCMGMFSFFFITIAVIVMSMLTTIAFRKIPYMGRLV